VRDRLAIRPEGAHEAPLRALAHRLLFQLGMQTNTQPNEPTTRPWDPQLESLSDEVGRLRDHLRVQAHLAGKEAYDGFHRLETQWQDVQTKLQRMRASAEASAKDARNSTVDALEDLRRRYWSLRDRISAKMS